MCVSPLAVFHSWLVIANQTTSQPERAAFAKPSIARNCVDVLCLHNRAYEDLCVQCDAALDAELGRAPGARASA